MGGLQTYRLHSLTFKTYILGYSLHSLTFRTYNWVWAYTTFNRGTTWPTNLPRIRAYAARDRVKGQYDWGLHSQTLREQLGEHSFGAHIRGPPNAYAARVNKQQVLRSYSGLFFLSFLIYFLIVLRTMVFSLREKVTINCSSSCCSFVQSRTLRENDIHLLHIRVLLSQTLRE